MDSNILSIFIDCMRKRSFAAVARDRQVDPATISRAVLSLEDELQLKLFQRTTRRIEPTQAGMVYFERVEPLVEELQKARLEAADVNQTPKGLLRISSPVSFAEMNITPLLPEFAAQYPEISFDYLLTDEDLDLIANHIDVGIRVGPMQDSRLVAIKLADFNARVCATPGYLKHRGRPETPSELTQHPCLVLGYRGFDRKRWRFQHRKTEKVSSVNIHEYLTSSNAMALKQCALADMGVALLATWMIRDELASGRLIDLFTNYETTSAQSAAAAWALYPSRDYLPSKTRVFVDFLKQHFH